MNDEQALWNWLACAARHAATDLRRSRSRYLQALARFAARWRPPIIEPDADGRLLAALEVALSKLPELDRALIESRYFISESLDVIGERHTLSARAVEGRLARLRARLREQIVEELKLDLR